MIFCYYYKCTHTGHKYNYYKHRPMNPYANDMYEQARQQSKALAMRMRSGTGVSKVISGTESQTHYQDSLERFQKDYSAYDKMRREQEKIKRQQELERKRIEFLERENKRWEVVEETEQMKQLRLQKNFQEIQQGKRKTATSNGLAYNPINLTYDRNPEGEKLRLRDEDYKIRGLVRAYNMDHSGNSGYNPLNGEERLGVDKIVPQELTDRYKQKLHQFEENRRLKVPHSSGQPRRNNIFQYY